MVSLLRNCQFFITVVPFVSLSAPLSSHEKHFLFFQIAHVLRVFCLCTHPSFIPTQWFKEKFVMNILHGAPAPSLLTDGTILGAPSLKESSQPLCHWLTWASGCEGRGGTLPDCHVVGSEHVLSLEGMVVETWGTSIDFCHPVLLSPQGAGPHPHVLQQT